MGGRDGSAKASMLIIFVIFSGTTTAQNCSPTSVQDILDAAAISRQIYLKTFKKGDKVPGMHPGYKIKRSVSKTVRGHSTKLLIAVKGHTEIVCFMGSYTGAFRRWWSINLPKKLQQDVAYEQWSAEELSYYYKAIKKLGMTTKLNIRMNQRKVIITGHSLGGAIASLFALHFAATQRDWFNNYPGRALITFGAPRTGNAAYAKLHDQLIPSYKKLRFVYNRDITPHIIPVEVFVHASREIWIEQPTRRVKQYKNGRPGWKTVDDPLVYHVCADGVDKSCSSQLCPLFPNANLANKANLSSSDHNMTKYIGALTKLKADRQKRKKFIADQCRREALREVLQHIKAAAVKAAAKKKAAATFKQFEGILR